MNGSRVRSRFSYTSRSCRRETLHRPLKSTRLRRWKDSDAGEHDSESGEIFFDIFECCGCGEAVLRRVRSTDDPAFQQDGGYEVRWFPPANVRDLPKWRFKLRREMRELLEEIYKSLDAENLRLPMMGQEHWWT